MNLRHHYPSVAAAIVIIAVTTLFVYVAIWWTEWVMFLAICAALIWGGLRASRDGNE